VQNCHVDGRVDDILQVSYPDLEVEIYRVNETPARELVLTISVRSDRYPTGPGLRSAQPRIASGGSSAKARSSPTQRFSIDGQRVR